MSWGDSFWWPHEVQVRDIAPAGGMGPKYSETKRTVVAEVLDERSLVVTAGGSQLVSETRVTVPLEADIAPGSLVTVWAGTSAEREAKVLSVGREQNDPPLPSQLVLRLQ